MEATHTAIVEVAPTSGGDFPKKGHEIFIRALCGEWEDEQGRVWPTRWLKNIIDIREDQRQVDNVEMFEDWHAARKMIGAGHGETLTQAVARVLEEKKELSGVVALRAREMYETSLMRDQFKAAREYLKCNEVESLKDAVEKLFKIKVMEMEALKKSTAIRMTTINDMRSQIMGLQDFQEKIINIEKSKEAV